MLDPFLLSILACPQCRGGVRLAPGGGLVCEACRLVYPIRDGIPVMLADAAGQLDAAPGVSK